MALRIIFFHLFTAMIAVNIIFAEEESDRLFGLPFFGGFDSNQSLPFLGFFSNSQLPSFLDFGSASRQVRSADHHESGDRADRGFSTNFVFCNYTAQGYRSCSDCSNALICFPWNVGISTNCTQLNLMCNNGRCSSNSTGCES